MTKIEWSEDGGWSGITPELSAKWKEAYPRVKLGQEFVRMDIWLDANKRRRKKNYKRFIMNWLSRANDDAPSPPPNMNKSHGEEWVRAIEKVRRERDSQ